MAMLKKSTSRHVADGIDIVQNDMSQNSTPTVIAWQKDQARMFGKSALQKAKRNMLGTFLYPTRFLGLCTDKAIVDREKKFVTNKI